MARGVGGILGRLAQLLGLNAVPVAGFFGQGWSSGTALAIYWVEGLLVIFFVAARIALHRRWTRKVGHYRAPSFTRTSRSQGGAEPPTAIGSGSLLGSYLAVAIPFTLAHGFFLGMLLLLFLPQEFGQEAGVALADLGKGTAGIVAFLALGLAIDLVRLRERSYRSIEVATERAMGRIFVIHMTIIFGMGAAMFFHAPTALFGVFAGFKTLFDLGGAFPHRELALEPPRWAGFLDRIKGRDGESFSDYWRRTEAREQALRAENEQAMDPAVLARQGG
jgi:hypothetical protein